jgi:GAF domain-containing protein/HAMP domain-containing protein
MTMETKNRTPRPTRSLAVTIATAFLALSITILLASGGIQLFFNIQAQQRALSSQQQYIALGASNTVNNFIEENFSVLSTSAWVAHPSTLSLVDQVQFMKTLLADQPAFRQFAIFDAENDESSMATRTQWTNTKKITSYVTSDILAKTEKGLRYIGSVYFDVVTNNEPLVLMAVPMFNETGDFQGTFAGELNLISMWNLANQIKVGDTGYAYVIDNEGKLIAYKDTARVIKGEVISKIKPVNDFILNPGITSANLLSPYTGLNGSLVVGSYATLGSSKWAVVTELPWQEAYQQTIQVGLVSVGILIALATLAVVAGILVARRLSIPLTELTTTAAVVAAGDLKQRAKVKGGLEIEALAGAFNHMTDQLQGLIGGLEERISERTRVLEKRSLELQNAAQIVREVSKIQDTDTLLDRVSNLVKERFGYYHTGIFLIDDNEEYAVLKASAGETGKLMVSSKHKLKIEETSIVGYVAKQGDPRITLDVGADSVHYQNPLLPYTRSEMALPLTVGNRVIGVLDIQSEKTNAFDQSSISVIQMITDQISIGFERAQLLQGVQKNESELQLTLQENTYRSWRNFLEQRRGAVGYQFDGVTIESLSKSSLDNLKLLQKDDRVAGKEEEITVNANLVTVPIQLRGQTLGTINFKFQEPKISPETLRSVEEAAGRLALALENARLVQDAQRLAMRERQINMISAQAQQSTNLETLLQNTVRELGNSLGVPNTFIQIGLVDSGAKKD